MLISIARIAYGFLLLLIVAALAAGLINSVAGGGMFIAFPALVFTGVPSIIANASSTVAVFPGVLTSAWAYPRISANRRIFLRAVADHQPARRHGRRIAPAVHAATHI